MEVPFLSHSASGTSANNVSVLVAEAVHFIYLQSSISIYIWYYIYEATAGYVVVNISDEV